MRSLSVFSSPDPALPLNTGVAGNQPEERKRRILSALSSSSFSLPSGPPVITLVDKPEDNLDLARAVQDSAMLLFLQSAFARFQKEYAVMPNSHLDCFTNGGPHSFVAAFSAPRQDGVQVPTHGVLGQACYYAMDKETPITESTYPALKWDLSVTRRCVQAILDNECKIAYALITHPGHHAGPSSYGGFCFVNHAALAARLLQKRFPRVAVVDVDYHSGNGTMAIFYNDPSVFFASIHGDPESDYPFNAGFSNQIGGPQALGATFNIPLPGGSGWLEYKAALLRVVHAVKDFGANALVVSLGLDTLRGDPVAFPRSRFNILPEDCVEMGDILLDSLGLPTIVVQEGGYELSLVPDAVTNFLRGSSSRKRSKI